LERVKKTIHKDVRDGPDRKRVIKLLEECQAIVADQKMVDGELIEDCKEKLRPLIAEYRMAWSTEQAHIRAVIKQELFAREPTKN